MLFDQNRVDAIIQNGKNQVFSNERIHGVPQRHSTCLKPPIGIQLRVKYFSKYRIKCKGIFLCVRPCVFYLYYLPLDPQAGWPGRYINVRRCGGLPMVLLQQKYPLELFVKSREFLPRFRVSISSRYDLSC